MAAVDLARLDTFVSFGSLTQIPSAYAHERLQLMKQLEKVKEMESADVEDGIAFSGVPADTERSDD